MIDDELPKPKTKAELRAEARAEKLEESKYLRQQRAVIARVTKYWTGVFEIEELRPAFALALTRILSRELRFDGPDSPMPKCVCSMELPHDNFPHYCPAAVPRTIVVREGNPCDVLLETVQKIGESGVGCFPLEVTMQIDGDTIRVRRGEDDFVGEEVLP